MASPSYFGDSNKKSEVNELKKLLDQADVQREPQKYRQVVQRVIACMTLGMDMTPLFMRMVKAGATNDLIQKKLVYLYICAYAKTNTQLVLLTINTLLKDIQDRNSMIRGLALRSMTSLNLPDVLEYIEEPVISLLEDPSNYVRRTAVMGCVKLYHLNPDFVEDFGVVEKLTEMLKDDDPQVSCNCISALDEILASDGGLTIDKTMAHSLLKRLKSMNEWCQCQVLNMLARYCPHEEEELYDILNIIDTCLKHPNSAVVMATIQLFFHLTKDNQNLLNDVVQRVKGPLVSIMSSSNYEVVYSALCHIELLLSKSPSLFDNDYKIFLLRLNDPLFLRRKKIQILTTIASQSNVEEIVSELSELVYDVDVELCQECIKAIGRTAQALPKAAEYCIDVLLSFLSCEIENITSQTIIVIRDLLPRYEKHVVAVLPQLKDCIDLVENPSGRAAIIWILGEYGQSIAESPYILEKVINSLKEEQSSEVKLQLLTAMMKLFFKRPPECQASLGKLLAYCIDTETHIDVHDRALLYYRLLKQDVAMAEKVVCSSQQQQPSVFSTIKLDSKTHKNELFNEFNTLSVIYGQPSVNFISQTIPYIKGTPYQQRDDTETLGFNEDTSSSNNAEITVGNLLGDFHITTQNEASVLQLSPNPSVSRTDFQQKWISLPTSSKITLSLSSLPSNSNVFEQALLSQNIAMMAFGVSNQTQKYFNYAKQESETACVFLIETNIDGENNTLTAEFKAEDDENIDEFVQIYEDIISNIWI